MHIIIKNKFLTYNNYKVKCSIGKRGISTKKREGDLKTPKGSFKIIHLFYRKDRIRRINSKIKTTIIKKNMGWCDDPKSKNYNKLIRFPFMYSAERLYRRDNIYDLILVLNYNMSPVKKKKGSAIFLHVMKNNLQTTKGCIAIKKNHLKKIINLIKKNTRVEVV